MAGESCNLEEEEAELLKATPSSPPPAYLSQPQRPGKMGDPCSASSRDGEGKPERGAATAATATPPRVALRCSSCRRRVELTGFRCRCGELFCCRHRHSAAHDCSFDYKAAAREDISRANPVIRCAKIIKI
ncbi:unnamed protein product [Spirodela intermedia]|uniref:AN1-type domain-containing protein n=2 Tax=Spirodela intermedia TaxID=51605 RepID=A0A7I8KRL3_SPIIN|nr:unnamed protein product [Spirodela intermedia]CAA6663959.1 unnamed protein product [Spirodela intermedia]CAA7400469.1 unnamed protein product [Spirodela intermedia]